MKVKYNNPEQLENTVRVLCRIIGQKQCPKNIASEYSLRRELVACILGSQVKYETAIAALNRLENTGLLANRWWNGIDDQFEKEVVNALSDCNVADGELWCYRFPRSRARQLAKARDAIAVRTLTERISSGHESKIIRRQLITDISGIGPKQASMFLRNTGVSSDLAILDTHVLRYFYIKGILKKGQVKISTILDYENIEGIVISYAESLGYPVGHLDLAIWATMRAARE